MTTPAKYKHINFKPPKGVQTAARRGLEARKNFKGKKPGLSTKQASQEGIGSGVARATSLANGKNVSPKVIKQMVAFFNRHEQNKDTERGKIAWDLWGGSPGRVWANKIKKTNGKS